MFKKTSFRTVILWILMVFSAGAQSGCARAILGVGFPKHEGAIGGLPLHGRVEILRDSWGIPHIYASDLHDLMVAQGFVHSQDRLWQMEMFRLMAQGRLSELGGREANDVDLFVRMLGIPDLRKRAARWLSQEERDLVEAYIQGINAFLEMRGEDLPLEFRFTSHVPRPWSVEDAFSILALMSWFLETNFRQELFAISAYRKIGKKELDDLFPSHPGADLPSEEGYERIRNLRLGHVLKVAKAFLRHRPICPLSEASNNWVIKRGPKGRPMLANDPHLALFVPGIWYLCHLSAPGLEVAGASIAGMPGIVIGHNSKVAWGFTNLMVDIVDIFVLKVDPRDPSRYFLGDDVLEMERQKEVICNKGGKCEERFFHKTRHGPVITQIKEGIDAVAVLKWPGTLEGQDWEEHSFRGLLGLMKARDVREAVQAGIHFTLLGLNLVVADVQGNIAWHATGGVPSRRGYSGRLPTYASEGDRDWIGRLPYSSLPHQYNPNSGWTATANQRVAADGGGPPITYLWCAQYRWERIASLLAELKDARIEDFARIQMDTHSMQAERILPAVLSHGYDDKRAIRAAEILRQWDREVTAQSKGAAVYEVFLTEWIRELLEDELGDDLELYYHSFPGFFLIQDVILQRPSSPLWDRKDTLKREEMREILERALVSTMRFLEHELGMDEDKWSWGGLHEVAFCHPGGRNWFLAPLLGRGPYPAGGDNHTVNVAGFIPIGGRYDVLLVPSMRMIIPMGELDRTKVIAPMGQSGQPFHPNYDDMIEGWRKGEFVELRFSRESVNRAAIKTLLLLP